MNSKNKINSSSLNNYLFDVSRQMVVAFATRAQTIIKNMIPIISEIPKILSNCLSNHRDSNIHV